MQTYSDTLTKVKRLEAQRVSRRFLFDLDLGELHQIGKRVLLSNTATW